MINFLTISIEATYFSSKTAKICVPRGYWRFNLESLDFARIDILLFSLNFVGGFCYFIFSLIMAEGVFHFRQYCFWTNWCYESKEHKILRKTHFKSSKRSSGGWDIVRLGRGYVESISGSFNRFLRLGMTKRHWFLIFGHKNDMSFHVLQFYVIL